VERVIEHNSIGNCGQVTRKNAMSKRVGS
jgi:hypothetical protein